MLVDGTHLGIKQEGMVAAVPRNVDEPDQQAVLVPGATQPRLYGRILSHEPSDRRPPCDSVSENSSSSCTSLRH